MKTVRQIFGTALLIAGAAGLLLAPPTLADQVILDDLIVNGSACVGQDCTSGESFGFDTLRLKENNLRVRAVDTSNSSSFPTNDWQLTFNDSANGGANKFSVDDIDSGRTPFTIEAGARSNALYVEADGDIGVGTSNPVVDLHVVNGNTPTLRLEQDGSSGFTPQTWDVAGNEANFFVRDASNGSTLPFKIKPGAPTSSIFVAASGDVGLGTESPADDLHVADAGAARLRLQNTSLSPTATQDNSWIINSNGTLRVTCGDVAKCPDNRMELDTNGVLSTANACIQLGDHACTAVGGTFTCVDGGTC